MPDPARSALADWAAAAAAQRPQLRALEAGALHVTVAFLGSRPAQQRRQIAAAAFGALAGREAPLLEAGELRGLPRRRPRLWGLALSDEGGRAAELAAAVTGALAAAGLFEPERRPFWPHVTLLRSRGREAGGDGPEGDPPAVAFEPGELVLYRSITAPGGARYEPLERIGLSGHGPVTEQ